jgi:hypothetical protein
MPAPSPPAAQHRPCLINDETRIGQKFFRCARQKCRPNPTFNHTIPHPSISGSEAKKPFTFQKICGTLTETIQGANRQYGISFLTGGRNRAPPAYQQAIWEKGVTERQKTP